MHGIDADFALSLTQSAWLMLCAALVLFMQAGFCCIEAGYVRRKNSINVALKVMMDFCASFAVFFIIGYSIMFGKDTGLGLIGEFGAFLKHANDDEILRFLFQVTFCSTAATIVSGGIAERCRFLPYFLMSIAIGAFIYPMFGHWVWGGGWLSQLGYYDFAGASVVHMTGAGIALAGIKVLGPRAGRFDKDGRPNQINGTNMPLVSLGVLILIFCWIGFNGGSEALSLHTPVIITNTLLAACFGGLIALLATWAYVGLAGADVMLNGVLGGLVAITASANVVTPQAAMLIGMAGGLIVPVATYLMEKNQLDDVVGAVPVHGGAGLIGILIVPIFITPEALAQLHGGSELPMTRSSFFWIQAIGATTCITWSYFTGMVFWKFIGQFSYLRVGPMEEQVGLNYSEHKVSDPEQSLSYGITLMMQGKQKEANEYFKKAEQSDLGSLSFILQQLAKKKS